MSRIDDDREAQRAIERQALKARQDQDRLKARQDTDSAFSRAMEKGHLETRKVQEQHLDAETHAQDEDARESEGIKEQSRLGDDVRQARGKEKLSAKSFLGRIISEQKMGQGREQDQRGFMQGQQRAATTSKDQDQSTGDAHAFGRSADGKTGAEAQKARGEGLKKAGAAMEGARADADAELRADADGGQKGGGDKKDGNEPGGQKGAPTFRFNPALMAPVAVAKPRDLQGSARLRALANEIAQKIVESVRVGKNALGQAEFQIDLRSSVLSGLSIKLSGSNGKIRALFRGTNKEVLKMLEEQGDALKSALEGRGLKLEEFKVEAHA